MDVWGWIAVYAVGLTLLQLLVYRYLLTNGGSLTRRVGTPFGDGDRDGDTSWSNGSSGPSESPRSPRPPDGVGRRHDATPRGERRPVDAWPAADAATGAAEEAAGRTCHHCGAVNESDEAFSHCWNCAHQL